MASREVEFARRAVRDNMKWAGQLLLCRRSWNQQDIDLGTAEHCPTCWDPILKQSNNSHCPDCHGTGYKNGYMPIEITVGRIIESVGVDQMREEPGLREQVEGPTLILPCTPLYTDGDLFAEVKSQSAGVPTELGRLWKLDGPVRRNTLDGLVSDNLIGNVDIADIVISQEGPVKPLLPTNILYADAIKMFNLAAFPYAVDKMEVVVPSVVEDYSHKPGWWH